MTKFRLACAILLFACVGAANADIFKPAYLELRELGNDQYAVLWKVPALGDNQRLAAYVQFPDGTEYLSESLVESHRDDVLVGEPAGGHVVLALQLLDERVLRVEPPGRPLQRVAVAVEALAERRGIDHHPEAPRIVGDRLADPGEGRGLGVPDAETCEGALRLEVQIEDRGVDVPGVLVKETNPHVGLVGRLIFREADVSLDAEERPAHGSGDRHELLADLPEMGLEIGDELERRLLHGPLVSGLVGQEPVPIVVALQIPHVGEQLGGQARALPGAHGPLLSRDA